MMKQEALADERVKKTACLVFSTLRRGVCSQEALSYYCSTEAQITYVVAI
jgi:hypothetical protein